VLLGFGVTFHVLGDVLAARAVLFEFRFDRTLRDTLFEFLLEVLELEVSILETVGDGALNGRQTFLLLQAGLEKLNV
jgi:hypothetical protein